MDASHRTELVQVCGYPLNVHHFCAASSDAPTILALHGFTGSGLDFLPLREAMGPDRWNWICPDLMGHGASDCPEIIDPYCLENTLQWIDRIRRQALRNSTVHLLGYSMGGRLAMHYLGRSGGLLSAVIGATPGIAPARERRQRRRSDDQLIARLQSEGMDAFCDMWEAQPLIHPQTEIAEPWRSAIAKRRRRNRVAGLRHSLLGCGSGVLPSLWDRLERLSGLHMLAGEKDTKFTEIGRTVHDMHRDISFHGIRRCGHATHLENPENTAALLESIFSR